MTIKGVSKANAITMAPPMVNVIMKSEFLKAVTRTPFPRRIPIYIPSELRAITLPCEFLAG